MLHKSITYSNRDIECCICLQNTQHYSKFCDCSIKTCIKCFDKLINITDKMLCNCCGNEETNKSYLKLVLKCPTCRKIKSSPLSKKHIDRLNLSNEIMVEKLLQYNMNVNKEIEEYVEFESDGYESDAERDSEDEEYEYNFIYQITGRHIEPKIELSDLWNTMLVMGLRANFDFC